MEKNWFIQFSTFVDENKRQVQYGLYAISFLGLTYALKSVRPFKKFEHVREIPQTFFHRKIKLNGSVLAIDEASSSLHVDHNPIFASTFRKRSTSSLVIRICGINLSSNGYLWLNSTVLGNCVHFTLLRKCNDIAICTVSYDKRDLAAELLRMGYATVDVLDFQLEKDKFYSKYYKHLLTLEQKAEKKKLGIWADDQHSTSSPLKDKLLRFIYELLQKLRK